MKKRLFAIGLAVLSVMTAMAQDKVTEISLPNPDKNVDMTVYQALSFRQSEREYVADKDIDNAVLSQLLWAACGVNRPEEKRITAASALNLQDIKVYVVRADGAWLYEPYTHSLKLASKKDLRKSVAGQQDFAATAPLCLVLVSEQSKFKNQDDKAKQMGAVDAGLVSGNIYMACTALGLGTVARATMDQDALRKALKLADTDMLVINHPVGYSKNPRHAKLPFHFEVVE